MKFASAVTLLIIGTLFVGFTVLSFSFFPRSLSLDSASLMMQTLFIAGLTFMCMSVRQLRRQTIAVSSVELLIKRKD